MTSSRSRLTVFFRLFLAIPHYFWAALIGTVVLFCVFLNWWVLLFRGRPSQGLHDFVAGYLRYTAHVEAYLFLAADPYPGFYLLGEKPYPVDLEIDPPADQSRWKTFFRFPLAIPALIVTSALLSGGPRSGGYYSGGAAFAAAFLLWWVGVFRGRSPRGLRDLVVYCIGYASQASAYLFLLTDRYPYSGPNAFASAREDEEPHPVRLAVTDDLRRSRVLVFFRLPVAIPHIVWFVGWTIVALLVSLLNWLCALVIGRPPRPFHRFLSAYLRYSTHLGAFLFLVGNPFPGFVGKAGSYPVDLELPEPSPQKRVVTFFRLILAFPAWLVAGGVLGALYVAGFLGWFAALFRGRMPDGLRNLGAYALRYNGQTSAYVFLLTSTLSGRRTATRPRVSVAAALATLVAAAHSSSGLGHRPLTAAARVRIPYAPYARRGPLGRVAPLHGGNSRFPPCAPLPNRRAHGRRPCAAPAHVGRGEGRHGSVAPTEHGGCDRGVPRAEREPAQ